MCRRLILCILSDRVFKLLGWYFSSHFKLFQLFALSCRVILRDDGSECSDGSLCCGDLFCCLCNCMLELFIGQILGICHFDQLLELSIGLISGFDGINSLFNMPRGIILRH